MKVLYDSRNDIRLTATGSASPILERGTADSGTGRWSVLKIPTLSFYEYCLLLGLDEPVLPEHLQLTQLADMTQAELGDLMERFDAGGAWRSHGAVLAFGKSLQPVPDNRRLSRIGAFRR